MKRDATQNTDPSAIFNARQKLGSLRDAFEDIAEKRLYADLELSAQFEEVARELDKACNALAAPALDLATVGTTSSGKSTFINALLGVQLAPTDADEMSTGLLTIEPSDRWSLISEPAQAGAEAAHDPQSIHDFMYQNMRKHVVARREGQDVSTPTSYTVRGPLFPLNPAHDFRLKTADSNDNITLRFFDLPGLRTIEDPENISVIKSKIRRAVSLVVINLQTFFMKEQREKLLEELRETVRELGDDPSTIIFIANKADGFTTTDLKNLPLEGRLKEVEREVRAKLQVREDADIVLLDFSALSYLRASQMFTTLELHDDFGAAQGLRQAFIDDFRKQYMRASLKDEGFQKLRQFIRQLEDDLEDGVDTEREVLVSASALLLSGSGHAKFWNVMYERLMSQGIRLIVFPVANVPLTQAARVLVSAREHAKVKQFTSREQFQSLQMSIESARETARLQFDRGSKELTEDLHQVVEALKQKQTNDSSDALYAKIEFGSELQELMNNLVTRLLRDISELFLEPFIPFLENKTPIDNVRTTFEQIPRMRAHAETLAKAYERLKDSGYMKYSSEGKKIRYKTGSQGREVDEVRDIREAVANFNATMRKAIVTYSEFYLNREVSLIAEHLGDWLAFRATKTWAKAKDTIESNQRYDASTMQLPDTLQCATPKLRPIQISHNVIAIPDVRVTSQTVKVLDGETHEDPDASCFKGAKRATFKEETYTEYEIPGAGDLIDTIEGGAVKAGKEFWQRFTDWFAGHIEQQGEELNQEFGAFLDTIQRTVDTMMNELGQETEEQQRYWADAENRATTLLDEVEAAKVCSGFARRGEGYEK